VPHSALFAATLASGLLCLSFARSSALCARLARHMLELTLLLLSLLHTLLDLVDDVFTTLALVVFALAAHNFVKVVVSHVTASLLDFLLEFANRLQVLPLLLMLGLHLELLDSLVELFVLPSVLLLLECLDFRLLREEAAFNARHVLIGFEHLSEEIIRARNWKACLHQKLHSLHHVLSRQVVATLKITNQTIKNTLLTRQPLF